MRDSTPIAILHTYGLRQTDIQTNRHRQRATEKTKHYSSQELFLMFADWSYKKPSLIHKKSIMFDVIFKPYQRLPVATDATVSQHPE